MSPMLPPSLIRSLIGVAGADHVLTDDASLERYSFDAITPTRLHHRASLADARVDAVARPADTAQVAAAVRAAHDAGVAVVPYGGGTGVMGAVIPISGGIALDLGRMNEIIDISTEDRLARVQPAVLLGDLDAAATGRGLMLDHDPWSVPIATVGGAIGTDSVGYRASKYGSMGQQVVAVEAVMGDGTVVRTRPLARQSSGPQLDGLFVGAEGTMGVITEATVQLFQQPEARAFSSIGFPSFEDGYPMVVRLFDMGLVPALVDLTEEEDGPEEAEEQGCKCVLYLGFEGYTEEVEAQRMRVRSEVRRAGGIDLGPGPTQRYWADRHAVALRWRERSKPLLPTERWKERRWRASDYLHIALPVSQVLDYKRFAEAVAGRHGVTIRESAIWTDSRLFSLFVYDPDPERAPERTKDGDPPLWRAVDELLDGALARDGGIEYCHGLGSKLDPWAEREWAASLWLARALKAAVDPAGTLNPGKLGLTPNAGAREGHR